MSVKVIQRITRKQDGRSKGVRIVRTPQFTVSEASAQAVVDLLNAGPGEDAEIATLPHFENVEDYQKQVVEAEKAKHLESALKKVAKLTAEERAALGIELPEKEEEGEGETTREDEELVSEAAGAATD